MTKCLKSIFQTRDDFMAFIQNLPNRITEAEQRMIIKEEKRLSKYISSIIPFFSDLSSMMREKLQMFMEFINNLAREEEHQNLFFFKKLLICYWEEIKKPIKYTINCEKKRTPNSKCRREDVNNFISAITEEKFELPKVNNLCSCKKLYENWSLKEDLAQQLIIVESFEVFFNKKEIKKVICTALNENACVLTGLQKQTFLVRGNLLQKDEIREIIDIFNETLTYIFPQVPPQKLTIDFIPVFSDPFQGEVSRHRENLYVIMIKNCLWEHGKMYFVCNKQNYIMPSFIMEQGSRKELKSYYFRLQQGYNKRKERKFQRFNFYKNNEEAALEYPALNSITWSKYTKLHYWAIVEGQNLEIPKYDPQPIFQILEIKNIGRKRIVSAIFLLSSNQRFIIYKNFQNYLFVTQKIRIKKKFNIENELKTLQSKLLRYYPQARKIYNKHKWKAFIYLEFHSYIYLEFHSQFEGLFAHLFFKKAGIPNIFSETQ